MNQPTPLLLLPGLMNDARVWDPLVAALPGDGRTSVVAPTHGADNVAALASAAIARMPAGRFAVAGFSLGGYVALEVCRQAADRLAGIALVDTGARADTDESKQNRQRMVDALQAGKADLAQVASTFAARVLHPDHQGDPVLMELLADMARSVGSEGFVRQQTAAMHRLDSRATLGELAVRKLPALVMCGHDDQVTPPALSEEMASLLGGASSLLELVVVPDAGHMVTLEQPAAAVAAFTRWVNRVDRADQVQG